jgi:hypothetical protein
MVITKRNDRPSQNALSLGYPTSEKDTFVFKRLYKYESVSKLTDRKFTQFRKTVFLL